MDDIIGQEILLQDSRVLPMLPLRDVVIYPNLVIPLFVGRQKSVRALEAASAGDKQVFLVAQKSANKDEPEFSDLYQFGAIASILQMLKLPDGTLKVLVEGVSRARVLDFLDVGGAFAARVQVVDSIAGDSTEVRALMRTVLDQFDQYVKFHKKIPAEVLTSLSSVEDGCRLVDMVAAHLSLKLEEKQNILEIADVSKRLEHLLSLLETEIDILQVEKRIRSRVKKQMEKSQREYYLNEQVKAIQKELGEADENAEIDDLENRIKAARMSREAQNKAQAELKKLKLMPTMSAEATVVRNYIETLIGLPWKKSTRVNGDLAVAEEILDADHYGLEKVKERILEYLAVQKRVGKLKGPILCLVGPPGVGKTSLGRSIAKAVNRKFVRMALGGVHDESEIRGHRRTYIGSMPGKVLQNITKVGVNNPLFLLDEIDKMGMDYRGDPASALLEVLDPEQNNAFSDHYLEVEYDLSNVMFVATSNTLNIPPALMDRMEVIRLEGYTESEKISIAMNYLLPKQLEGNGLAKGEMIISADTMREIVRYYTREAGVRNLDREISKICRKVVKENSRTGSVRNKGFSSVTVTGNNLEHYLGVKRYDFGLANTKNQIGQVTGLAWTEVGGDLLTIETAVMPGKGKTTSTGKLGEVMQESVQAAMSVVRSRAELLGIADKFYEDKDIHVHFPEGATPKDGPSAGIAICTALVSVLTGIAVRSDVAMTGEITLRGEVLPIGGLKEKLLAAQRGGIKRVLIPEQNVKDLAEVPETVLSNLEICPVRWIDKVLEVALERTPSVVESNLLSVPVIKEANTQEQSLVLKH